MFRNVNGRIRIKLVYSGEALAVFEKELISVKILGRQSTLFYGRVTGIFYNKVW